MANKNNEELMKMDLYKLLGIEEDATSKEINKAYRKKAIEFHPDKNPDNPEKAKDMFDLIKKAKDLLKDIGQRAEYDHKQKAKRAAKAKVQQYDAKRRKMAEDLAQREKRWEEESRQEHKKDEEKAKVERLRAENLKLVEERNREQEEAAKRRLTDPVHIKVKWGKSEEQGYNKGQIEKIFSKYGKVEVVVKKRTAIVEFQDPSAAILAKSIEQGLAGNPFKSLEWVGAAPLPHHHQRKLTRTTAPSMDDLMRQMREAQAKKMERSEQTSVS